MALEAFDLKFKDHKKALYVYLDCGRGLWGVSVIYNAVPAEQAGLCVYTQSHSKTRNFMWNVEFEY